MSGVREVWERFEKTIVENRRIRWLLIAINLGGAVYGFSWYFDQLAQTDPGFWPVVPDSPLSALAFGVILVLYTYGKRARVLEAAAYMMMIKYGLWAALVLSSYAVIYQNPTFETTHLTISHLGMALEALIFLKYYHPGIRAGLLGIGWVLINDFFDYTYLTHPSLPHPDLLPLARIIAYGLTVVIILVYFFVGRAESKRGGPRNS